MFQFPELPASWLFIHQALTMHYHSRIPPFGNLRVNGYLLLTVAYRSLSRPSSAPSAKASALCPSQLDLVETAVTLFGSTASPLHLSDEQFLLFPIKLRFLGTPFSAFSTLSRYMTSRYVINLSFVKKLCEKFSGFLGYKLISKLYLLPILTLDSNLVSNFSISFSLLTCLYTI